MWIKRICFSRRVLKIPSVLNRIMILAKLSLSEVRAVDAQIIHLSLPALNRTLTCKLGLIVLGQRGSLGLRIIEVPVLLGVKFSEVVKRHFSILDAVKNSATFFLNYNFDLIISTATSAKLLVNFIGKSFLFSIFISYY